MGYVSGWSAYYAGGAVYSSKTTPISALPSNGMLIWMLYFKDGTRRILHGNDRYFWHNDGSTDGIFANSDDLASDISSRYPGALIFEGQLVSDKEMNGTLELAMRTKIP